jgi:predicted transcriptional regulator
MSKEKRKMISFSVDEEVFERLHQLAFENHQSMSSILTGWVMKSKIKNEVSWRQKRLFDD